jgi:hypothetical protein
MPKLFTVSILASQKGQPAPESLVETPARAAMDKANDLEVKATAELQ